MAKIIERRRTRAEELKIMEENTKAMHATTKVLQTVSSQLADYPNVKANVAMLVEVVGRDENCGMRKKYTDLDDTVNGNKNKNISGLVQDVAKNSYLLTLGKIAIGLLGSGLLALWVWQAIVHAEAFIEYLKQYSYILGIFRFLV
jgi:hypothetical protein